MPKNKYLHYYYNICMLVIICKDHDFKIWVDHLKNAIKVVFKSVVDDSV